MAVKPLGAIPQSPTSDVVQQIPSSEVPQQRPKVEVPQPGARVYEMPESESIISRGCRFQMLKARTQ